jgi:hypothetical protein
MTTMIAEKPETKKQAKEREHQEACQQLRELFPAGSTVYCIVRSVSRSGMSREISFFTSGTDRNGKSEVYCIDWLVCRALDVHLGKSGVKVSGCGMDMGFHVVYNIGRVIYRDGFHCTQQQTCPSNDHRNSGDGRNDYTDHLHSDPGYALNHRWL